VGSEGRLRLSGIFDRSKSLHRAIVIDIRSEALYPLALDISILSSASRHFYCGVADFCHFSLLLFCAVVGALMKRNSQLRSPSDTAMAQLRHVDSNKDFVYCSTARPPVRIDSPTEQPSVEQSCASRLPIEDNTVLRFFGQRVSTVPSATLPVETMKFFSIRGFDEIDPPLELNDVDLCSRRGRSAQREGCNSSLETRSNSLSFFYYCVEGKRAPLA
jgi:hypothetical protein